MNVCAYMCVCVQVCVCALCVCVCVHVCVHSVCALCVCIVVMCPVQILSTMKKIKFLQFLNYLIFTRNST